MIDCRLEKIRQTDKGDLFWYVASCGATGAGQRTPDEARQQYEEHQGLHRKTHTFKVEVDGYSARRVRSALTRASVDYTEQVK